MRKYLRDWAAQAKRAALAREAGPSYPLQCDTCGCSMSEQRDEAVYRCLDCFHPPNECKTCAVSYHRRNPFHRMDEWVPSLGFWARKSLGSLGFVINLGHERGLPCPLNDRTRKMTIVHDHGIHEYHIRFCLCPQEDTLLKTPEPVQLIEAGLWPGSWKTPCSAYTISVLRDHHLLSLQSQISAFDYVAYLERLTDNVVTDDVPVCA